MLFLAAAIKRKQEASKDACTESRVTEIGVERRVRLGLELIRPILMRSIMNIAVVSETNEPGE